MGMLVGACLIGQVRAAPASDPARKQAAAAVEAAARAFAAGDYARALAGFERAMALRPAPKLHFNLGVCHEELMLAARARGDAAAESEHAAGAIAAFNAYLREVPGADDRAEVEDRVRGLGGTPLTQPTLKPIPPPRSEPPPTEPPPMEPSTPEPTPEFPPPPTPEAPSSGSVDYADPTANAGAPQPVASPQPRAPIVPRGRVGAALGVLGEPQLDPKRVDGAVQGSLTLRFGGFVGARRRVYLGGAALLATVGDPSRLALSTQAVTADVEYGHPIGRARRVEFVAGAFLAGAREALRARSGRPAGPCAAGRTVVSQRGGGGAGGRVGLLVLLGAGKNHELGVRLSTAVLGFGKGTASCEPRPFADLDVPRARWVVFADTGYSFRF